MFRYYIRGRYKLFQLQKVILLKLMFCDVFKGIFDQKHADFFEKTRCK